jgi:hypothetical protein
MAEETNYTDDDHWFIGEDKRHRIGGGSGKHILVHPGGGGAAVVDISGWLIHNAQRVSVDDANAVFTIPTDGGTITIGGVYNSSQGSNTQYVESFMPDNLTGLHTPGTKAWAFKRMDADQETVFAFGTVPWRNAAVH